MWALKIKVREKWNIYNYLTRKYKVRIYFYSHNFYKEKGKINFIASCIVEGKENQRKRFLEELKSNKKVVNIEWNNDFLICTYYESENSPRSRIVPIAYNPRLIFIKPVIIDEEGWEEWEIASPKRKDLIKFITSSKKLKDTEIDIFYFRKQKIDNLMIYSMMPKLTDKQKKAFIMAVENGYYGYPRGIKLEKLAKAMCISTSTYQFHLAKAEAKLMPFLVKRFIS